jgi:hypothetical protein
MKSRLLAVRWPLIARYHLIRGLALIVGLGLATRAQAAFHIWNIAQVYSNSSGTLQFIEMFTSTSGQQFVNGQSITVNNSTNTLHNTFTIPSTPNYDAIDSANHFLLFGTAGLHAAGGPTPDFIIPNGFLFTGGGMISFFGTSGTTNNLTYPALPTDGIHALTYNSGPQVVNSPENYSFQTGQVEVLGDINRDGHVTIADVAGLGSALTDLSKYQATHGASGGALTNQQLLLIADLNGDGKVTNTDVQSLLTKLGSGGGSLSAVPEPAAITLLASGLMLLIVFATAAAPASVTLNYFRSGSVEGPR